LKFYLKIIYIKEDDKKYSKENCKQYLIVIDDNDGINKRRRSIDFSRNQVGFRKDIIILSF